MQCVETVHGGHGDTRLLQAAAQRREPVGGLSAPKLLEQLLGELVEPITDRLEVRRGGRRLFWMRLPSGEHSPLHDLAGVDLAPQEPAPPPDGGRAPRARRVPRPRRRRAGSAGGAGPPDPRAARPSWTGRGSRQARRPHRSRGPGAAEPHRAWRRSYPPRRGAEMDPQLPGTGHRLSSDAVRRPFVLGHRSACAAATARLSSVMSTVGSPRKPSVRPAVACATRCWTSPTGRPVTRATRAVCSAA